MTPIVMSETKEARRVVGGEIRGDLASSPFYALSLAARYLFAEGNSDSEIELCLYTIADKLEIQSYVVESVMNSDFRKRPLVDVDYVDVYEEELNTIDSVNGGMKRKVLFSLLCLAKFRNEYTGSDSFWENRSIDEVSALANVSLSKERMCYLLYELKEDGLISLSNRVSNTNVHVDFAVDGGIPLVTVKDMRNLGWQYEAWKGKRFAKCERCGAIFPYNANHKLCGDCRGGRKFTFKTGIVPACCSNCGRIIFIPSDGYWYGNLCENCK